MQGGWTVLSSLSLRDARPLTQLPSYRLCTDAAGWTCSYTASSIQGHSLCKPLQANGATHSARELRAKEHLPVGCHQDWLPSLKSPCPRALYRLLFPDTLFRQLLRIVSSETGLIPVRFPKVMAKSCTVVSVSVIEEPGRSLGRTRGFHAQFFCIFKYSPCYQLTF